MKPADQYQINFPYGATSSPYSSTHPHQGDDRPCPTGTPIIIAGTVIGLTGYSGFVQPPTPAGAHLHIQEWHGNYSNTRQPQNAFQPGTVTNIDSNGTQGDGSFGKFITIQADDGWNDSYCHLSQIDVNIGEVIEEDMSYLNSKIETEEENRQLFLAWVGRNPYSQEQGRYIGWKISDATEDIAKNQDRQNINQMMNSYYYNNSQIPGIGEPNVIVNGEEYVKKG